jgi:hypothetical protein
MIHNPHTHLTHEEMRIITLALVALVESGIMDGCDHQLRIIAGLVDKLASDVQEILA